MKRILLVAYLLSGPAYASDVMTVSWFADHPAVMADVLRVCQERPDLARRNGNCINADAARAATAQRALDSRAAPGLDRTNINPYSAREWATRSPEYRREQIWICDSVEKSGQPVDPTSRRICAAARAAGG